MSALSSLVHTPSSNTSKHPLNDLNLASASTPSYGQRLLDALSRALPDDISDTPTKRLRTEGTMANPTTPTESSLGSIHSTEALVRGISPISRAGSPFSFSDLLSPSHTACPPTPFCSSQAKKTIPPFVDAALRIHRTGKIVKNSTEYLVAPVRGIRGQNSQIFQITSRSPFLEGLSNNQIYIKVFLEEHLEKSPLWIAGKDGYLASTLEQYEELESSNLPHVPIYNVATAKTDGYLIVKKLNPFQIPWSADTSLDSLSATHRSYLDQIKSFVEYGVKSASCIPLDLNKGNFGIDEEGKLLLLDYMEVKEDEPYAFELIKNICLDSLSMQSPSIRAYLAS